MAAAAAHNEPHLTSRRSWPLRRPDASSATLQRRPSATDRINHILETARERADTMTPGPAAAHSPGRRALSSSPVPATAAAADEAPPADENTGIVARGAGPNYQAIHPADGSVRSRRSAYSRPSQPELDPWAQQLQQDRRTSAPNGTASGAAAQGRSWWRRPLGRFQSVELENKGSVARDHLALERTFLAWLRTSLAFASIGIAVTQLFRLNTTLPSDGDDDDNVKEEPLRHVGKPLGAAFLGISIVILLLGYRRYFVAQDWVIKGKFPASRGTIVLVSLVAFAIMALSLVVVIVIKPAGDQDL